MASPTQINLYVGNGWGAIGDLIRQEAPTGFLEGGGEPTFTKRIGAGETLVTTRGANGSVSMTLTSPSGETLMEAAGIPRQGEGLTTFKMFGNDVPHTQANHELAQGAMFRMQPQSRQGFRAAMNDMVGQKEFGHYTNGARFEEQARAGTLHDNRPANERIELRGASGGVKLRAFGALGLAGSVLHAGVNAKEANDKLNAVVSAHPELHLSPEAQREYAGVVFTAKTEQGMTMGISQGYGFSQFSAWADKNNIPPEIRQELNPTSIMLDKKGQPVGNLVASATLPSGVVLNNADAKHDFDKGPQVAAAAISRNAGTQIG